MSHKSLIQLLTFLGVLPFYISAIIYFMVSKEYGFLLLISYSAIITSFIAGIHFAYSIKGNGLSNTLIILSNLLALASWSSIILNYIIGLIVQFSIFSFLLFVDSKLFSMNIIPEWFYSLRIKVTCLVIFPILIMICI